MFRSVRSKRALSTQAEIQITPLIDMVFILLIFFLVTTSFVSETGLSIERPQSSLSDELPKESVSVAIDAGGQITVDGQRAGLLSIRPLLQKKLRNRQNLAAVIVGDRAVPLDRIVRVMDEVKAAGVDQIAIAATKEQ